jgi:glyoxylase-like metal-dependent hydrolase (beta-lactamase superfamily II)
MEYPKITKHRVLKEGDMLEESGITLTVIETPGHCAGALCFYSEDQRTLFSGDTVFPDFALPRTDLPTSDYEKLKKSYKKLAKLDVETIYPGHGEMVKNKEYVKKILEQL